VSTRADPKPPRVVRGRYWKLHPDGRLEWSFPARWRHDLPAMAKLEAKNLAGPDWAEKAVPGYLLED
jgi:hypothetical protein